MVRRWIWAKNERWRNEPDRKLSWDEVVEDMSVAVGEDLFPFFRDFGTTLGRSRWPSTIVGGVKLELPAAQIAVSPAGKRVWSPPTISRTPGHTAKTRAAVVFWGDFDYIGVVDGDDYTQWLNGYLRQGDPSTNRQLRCARRRTPKLFPSRALRQV